MKFRKTLNNSILFAATSFCPCLRAQSIDFAKAHFTTENIGRNVYVFTGSPGIDPIHPDGAGGRVGALVGPDGILMVDASYAPLSEQLLISIRKISSSPIRFLVNTHDHPDHTGGNPKFVKMGALLIGREEAREELSKKFPPAMAAAIGNAASETDPDRLHVLTYGMGQPIKIRMDGETADLIPLRAAHTGGDTIVRFEKADVIMIGDFFRNYGYPYVDSAHGGTFKGTLEALDAVMRLAGPMTILVPGHGTVIHVGDIAPYRNMILDVQAKVKQMVREGKNLQEVLAAKPTSSYDSKVPGALDPLPAGLGTSANRFVTTLFSELKADL